MDRMAEFMSENGKLVTDGIQSEKIPIDMNQIKDGKQVVFFPSA